jgi:hypothetical protein
MLNKQLTSSLPEAIRNDRKLYEGDLIHYARALFHHAQNLSHPYHNFRHMFHVLWLVHDACQFYDSVLSPRQMRTALIAALFHDFNHCGMMGGRRPEHRAGDSRTAQARRDRGSSVCRRHRRTDLCDPVPQCHPF